MKKALKTSLAFLLALALCVSLGCGALAAYWDDWYDWDKWYDDDYDWNYDYGDDYSDWYLYLFGSGTYELGDYFDAGLYCNPQMDTGIISWSYNSGYLTHLGDGIFVVTNADAGDRSLTITATYNVGSLYLSDSCSITISGYNNYYNPYFSDFYVSLDDSSLTMNVGEGSFLVATCRGGTTPYSYRWYSENTNIARITSGAYGSRADLRAEGTGTTRVVCETSDRYGNYDYAYCTVSVYGTRARVTSVSLSAYSMTLSALSSRSLSASITDPGADYSISWSSSNPRIVDVTGSGRNVTVTSYNTSGTANVTVNVRDNSTGTTRSETCRITVEANKNSVYNPTTTINLGTTTAGTRIYDSLRAQFQTVYGEVLSDSAIITFGACNNNIAARKLVNGAIAVSGTGYTMAQYKDMYTEAYTCGVYSTPYTVTQNQKSLTGNISVEITPAHIAASIPLPAYGAYVFTQATPAGSGITILSSAIRNALAASTNINWSYVHFDTSSTSVGTLYANTAWDGITPTTDLTAQALTGLYFVPATPGTFSTEFTAYNSNGGAMARGTLFILVPGLNDGTPGASAASQDVLVNGVPVLTETYRIDGESYFKLRDVAAMLNGTGSQFEVGYDDAARAVTVTTGRAYTPNGTELVKGWDKSDSCVIGDMTIKVNGVQVRPSVFIIGGNNFFRLRDLGDMIGFAVGYDETTQTVLLTTK